MSLITEKNYSPPFLSYHCAIFEGHNKINCFTYKSKCSSLVSLLICLLCLLSAPRIPPDKRIFTTSHTPSCLFQEVDERSVSERLCLQFSACFSVNRWECCSRVVQHTVTVCSLWLQGRTAVGLPASGLSGDSHPALHPP